MLVDVDFSRHQLLTSKLINHIISAARIYSLAILFGINNVHKKNKSYSSISHIDSFVILFNQKCL